MTSYEISCSSFRESFLGSLDGCIWLFIFGYALRYHLHPVGSQYSHDPVAILQLTTFSVRYCRESMSLWYFSRWSSFLLDENAYLGWLQFGARQCQYSMCCKSLLVFLLDFSGVPFWTCYVCTYWSSLLRWSLDKLKFLYTLDYFGAEDFLDWALLFCFGTSFSTSCKAAASGILACAISSAISTSSTARLSTWLRCSTLLSSGCGGCVL